MDIQSSLLENIRNPVLYMTDQLTIHCSSTLELSKGFAFFQEWQPQRSDFINHMVQKRKYICQFCDGLFFSNHMFEIKHYNKKGHCGTETTASYDTCDRKGSLSSEGCRSLLRRIHVVLLKRKLNKSKLNTSDLL